MSAEEARPDVTKLVDLMREALRQYEGGPKWQLTVMCPYCGGDLRVNERDVTDLRVATAINEPTRIDVEFLCRHRCASQPC